MKIIVPFSGLNTFIAVFVESTKGTSFKNLNKNLNQRMAGKIKLFIKKKGKNFHFLYRATDGKITSISKQLLFG